MPRRPFIILIVVLVFSMIFGKISAQTLTVNLEGVLNGKYGISYDRFFKRNMLFTNGITYQNYKTGILTKLLYPINIESWQNISLSSGLRYYLSHQTSGVYLSTGISIGYGYVEFDYYSLKNRFDYVHDPILKGVFYESLAKVGYEWKIKTKVSFAIEVGYRYRNNKIDFSRLDEYQDFEIWGEQDTPFTITSSDFQNDNYYKGFSPSFSLKLRYNL